MQKKITLYMDFMEENQFSFRILLLEDWITVSHFDFRFNSRRLNAVIFDFFHL